MAKRTLYKTHRGLVSRMRDELKEVDFILLFAHNGVGKTRTSMEFKDKGKRANAGEADTLYFNAFTEDLFVWENDLPNDEDRHIKMTSSAKFFEGFEELAMEDKVRAHLIKYANFDIRIDYDEWKVSFSQEQKNPKYHPNNTIPEYSTQHNVKISRGEENLFKWCVYLALCEIAMDKDIDAYNWVKYFYIDDPISSLDDNNAIGVATELASLLKNAKASVKTVVSTHHSLFYNVLCNELKKEENKRFFLYENSDKRLCLQTTGDTPYFQHVALLFELQGVVKSGKIYAYHFNALRSVFEKTASFFGKKNIAFCLAGVDDSTLHERALNLLSHGNYSLYQPKELSKDNKDLFENILTTFVTRYGFEPLQQD